MGYLLTLCNAYEIIYENTIIYEILANSEWNISTLYFVCSKMEISK